MDSSIPLSERIGEIIREAEFPIEKGKIGEFSRAMRDANPIYRSIDAARNAGYDAIPAPLTYSVASALYAGGNAADMVAKLGLDLSRTVHGEQRWVYHRPILSGQTLHAVTRIANVDRKASKSGDILRVLTVTEYRDDSQNLIVSEFMLTIELPSR